jgi:hypothetical protein
MRSQKRRQRKYRTYKQRGGNFFDKVSTTLTEQIYNNPRVQNITSFFSQPSLVSNMSESLFSKAQEFKTNIYTRAKERIQGLICTAGGSKKTQKMSKNRRRRVY